MSFYDLNVVHPAAKRTIATLDKCMHARYRWTKVINLC